MALDELVKNLDNDDFNISKKDFPDKGQYLNKNLAFSYEFFNSVNDYRKHVDNFKKEDFLSKFKKKCPDDDEKNEQGKLLDFLIFKLERN